jgi:hypothetical protein
MVLFGALFAGLGLFFLWVELFNGGMIAGKGPSSVGWVLGPVFFLAGAMVMLGAYVSNRQRAREQRILKTGLHASARLMGARELAKTGETIGYELTLEVSLEGRPPYQVKLRTVVAESLRVRLTEGAALAVRVDPTDAQQIAIAW